MDTRIGRNTFQRSQLLGKENAELEKTPIAEERLLNSKRILQARKED
jgi:hypothetical protein